MFPINFYPRKIKKPHLSYHLYDNNENNFFDYQPGYECAAFSSSYVLRHYGYKDTGLKLFETFPDKIPSGDGAFPTGIISLFESRGFNAEFITNASIDDMCSCHCIYSCRN